MTSAAEARRGSFENGLAAMVHARKRLELVTLRVRQAEECGLGCAGVLGPAVDDLRVAVEKLRLAQRELGELWQGIDWEGTPPATPS